MSMISEVFGAGMLTGLEIERRIHTGDIKITPFDSKKLNPNSYNLSLAPSLKVYKNEVLDSHADNEYEDLNIPEEGLILKPNMLYIGRTIERTSTDKFIPMINGRSSGGRLGLSVHICAGFGDIGFDGTWTLEITVVHPLKIYAGDEVAQVCFFTPYGDSRYQYNGRYQYQEDATTSRFFKEKDNSSMIGNMIYSKNKEILYNEIMNQYGPQALFDIGIRCINDFNYSLELKEDEHTFPDGKKDYISNSNGTIIGRVFYFKGVSIYVRKY